MLLRGLVASVPGILAVPRAGCDEPALVGVDRDLDSVSDTEFLQDAGDMRLGGRVGDDKAVADLGVGVLRSIGRGRPVREASAT